MIEFNQETRQFTAPKVTTSILKPGRGYVASGAIGGAAGWATAKLTEADLRKKYIAEGKTPEQIEALLDRRRSKMKKSGIGIGLGARFVGGRVRNNFNYIPGK